MSKQIVPIYGKGVLEEDGILFVRTEGIIQTMVNIPLIIASLVVISMIIPVQNSFASTKSLELILFSDGSTHISTQIDVDPLEPDFVIDLYGPSVDNFVTIDEHGFLLPSQIIDSQVTIDSFGSTTLLIDYDIHDLISKEGRVWTFSFDSPYDYSLLMPQNSIIVGMNILPQNMEIENEQSKLTLSSGLSEINYIFGTTTPPTTTPPTTTPPTTTPPTTNIESDFDYSFLFMFGIGIIVTIVIIIFVKRKQTNNDIIPKQTISNPQIILEHPDPETIFRLRPEMRDDDKEIIQFISKNGGEALESELRKKFLQPRTTMWRAVKRLERQGVVEITKKDLQNLVKIKKELEEME